MQPGLGILTQEGMPTVRQLAQMGSTAVKCWALGTVRARQPCSSPRGAQGPEGSGGSGDPGSSSGSATDGPELLGYLSPSFLGLRVPVK